MCSALLNKHKLAKMHVDIFKKIAYIICIYHKPTKVSKFFFLNSFFLIFNHASLTKQTLDYLVR